MKKNGILTLLFALIPGAGEMYQGYMKRGLSLITMFCLSVALGAWMGIEIFYIGAPILYMYSFFDTFNLRAQIGLDAAPADDYLVHFDTRDRRLEQLMAERHKLLGWLLIAFGGMVAYQNIIMNTLGDLLWRWGKESPIFRALYLVMDQLPEVLVCVVLIVCGIWLVKGPRTAKERPEGRIGGRRLHRIPAGTQKGERAGHPEQHQPQERRGRRSGCRGDGDGRHHGGQRWNRIRPRKPRCAGWAA